MKKSPTYWAVVPAAGVGKRMGGLIPKQYLQLHGSTVIEHTLSRLCRHPQIAAVVVSLGAGDEAWPTVAARLSNQEKLLTTIGGAERCHSVYNGLLKLEGQAREDDWVLVHDAARPCLTQAHLAKLIAELRDDEVGGILAVPVADTLKRSDAAQHIVKTENRELLWQAQTPQMFRAGLLAFALQQAANVTDEASAIEALGLRPKLVAGDSSNFKVTYPQDIKLAALLLGDKR